MCFRLCLSDVSHDGIHVVHIWQDYGGRDGFSLHPLWCYTFSACSTADVCHLDHLIKVTLVGKKWKLFSLTPACAEIYNNSFIPDLSVWLYLDSHSESATSICWSYFNPIWEIQLDFPPQVLLLSSRINDTLGFSESQHICAWCSFSLIIAATWFMSRKWLQTLLATKIDFTQAGSAAASN